MSNKNQVETSLTLFLSDLDFQSVYPCVSRISNIARDTLRSAVFQIEGKESSEVMDYFSNIINVRENSVIICAKFHSMPTYRGIYNTVKKQLEEGSNI